MNEIIVCPRFDLLKRLNLKQRGLDISVTYRYIILLRDTAKMGVVNMKTICVPVAVSEKQFAAKKKRSETK